ncbi:hypothetical protein KSP40_PGU010372 [Platanthera guangdongensis]|uniref:Uncharacterized protein n=1 Tax=Platanthera guangdongensis TaxID=2320717 RepID=A0ABR2N563_9ASPA
MPDSLSLEDSVGSKGTSPAGTAGVGSSPRVGGPNATYLVGSAFVGGASAGTAASHPWNALPRSIEEEFPEFYALYV